MPNAMKRRGDQYERDIREWLRNNGFPGCERTKAGYERDAGDLHLDPTIGIGPGVVAQCKNVKTPVWTDWLDGLKAQIAEARAEVGFLVWKRSRPGKPPLHLAVMPLDSYATLLRRAGYGTELDADTH